MKQIAYLIVALVTTCILSACQDCTGGEVWYYLIETEDSTTECEMSYDTFFDLVNDTYKARRRDTISTTTDSVTAGLLHIGYSMVNSSNPDNFVINLRRTQGKGTCTYYIASWNIPDELYEHIDSTGRPNHVFVEWIRNNSDYCFRLRDNNEMDATIQP